MEAYVNGVSTRAVDDLVAAVGESGISKFEVSRDLLWAGRAGRGVSVPAVTTSGSVWVLDATYLHVRRTRQVTSMAVVATPVSPPPAAGKCLGLDVGDSEDEVFGAASSQPQRARSARGAVGDLRLALRSGGGVGSGVPRDRTPTLPGPLRPQPACSGPQVPQRHGRGGLPHHLLNRTPRRRLRRGTPSVTS